MSQATGGVARLGGVAALAAIALAALAVVPTLDRVGPRGPDEAHYRVYAANLLAEGPGAFREFFRGYVADSQRWRFPNPLRMACFAAAAAWGGLFGTSFEALSAFSLLCHLLAVGVCYAFARRWLGDPRAVFVAALVAFSPLWLGLSRRALMDSFATLTSLLALWAFFEAVRRPGSARLRWLFSVAFGLALLAKETAVLLALPFAAWLLVEVRVRGNPLPLAAFLLSLAVPALACAGLWTLAAGDPGTLLRLVEIILSSPETNPYALAYGGGPWYRYVLDFLLLSPWPTLLALFGLGAFALRAGREVHDPLLGYLAAVIGLQLLAYAMFTKNVRYVALLELPLRVFAIWALWELCSRLRGRRALAACGAVVALLCWADYQSFRALFVEGGLYDPVTAALLSLRGGLPVE